MPTKIFSIILTLFYCFSQFGWAFGQTPADVQTKIEGENIAVQLPWEVCNETSFVLDMASVIMPDQPSSNILVTQGWVRLRPGQCQSVAAKKGTPRFVYARSASFHQGGIRQWSGPHEYCIGEESFSVPVSGDCQAQNLKSANFLRIIPTEHRTAFVEPADYGSNAQTAGLQRLLKDNNYAVSRIDGISGRRTNNLLNDFLEKLAFDTKISVAEKYSALEQAALAGSADIGVSVCNNSDAPVWTAIGTMEDEGWKSTGWWSVDPQQCTQIYNTSLIGKRVHYYARQENAANDDKILKITTGAAKELCIGEARFSAYTHEFCEDQGYVTAKFKALPEDQTGAQINLENSDFSDPALSELR